MEEELICNKILSIKKPRLLKRRGFLLSKSIIKNLAE
jgi:hypothetical protein